MFNNIKKVYLRLIDSSPKYNSIYAQDKTKRGMKSWRGITMWFLEKKPYLGDLKKKKLKQNLNLLPIAQREGPTCLLGGILTKSTGL